MKVDVSNVSDTSTINTYFYDMDSIMVKVIGIVYDTMLIADNSNGLLKRIYTI